MKDLTVNKVKMFEKNPTLREFAKYGVGVDNIFWGDYPQWKSSRKLFHQFFSF